MVRANPESSELMAIVNLQRYYARIYSLLHTRRDCAVDALTFEEYERERFAVVEGSIQFWDGSRLVFAETLTTRGVALVRTRYVYQYHDEQGRLRFRYDNAPHHPQIATHPHHKHSVDLRSGVERIEATSAPNLDEVLREIERFVYPDDQE